MYRLWMEAQWERHETVAHLRQPCYSTEIVKCYGMHDRQGETKGTTGSTAWFVSSEEDIKHMEDGQSKLSICFPGALGQVHGFPHDAAYHFHPYIVPNSASSQSVLGMPLKQSKNDPLNPLHR